jgi:hypothetical protein
MAEQLYFISLNDETGQTFLRRGRKHRGHRPARFYKSVSELFQYIISIS